MARGLIVGLGAFAALSGAVATGVYVNRGGDRAPASARSAGETVCIESNVRLVEGMAPACLTPAQYEALRDNAVIGGDGAPLALNLASPEAEGQSEVVRSCVDYDARIEDGWHALTGADMRREEYFARACNSLALLVKAKPARSTHFDGGRADKADLRSMAMGDAVAFGEVAPSADVAVEAIDRGVWKVTIGAGETIVYEIAHADFTGDGLGEILAYVSVGSPGGTARIGAIGFLEKPDRGGGCSFRAQ